MSTRPFLDLRTFVTERVFACSSEVLFRAFSDPTLLAQWWGPAGFRNSFHEFEFAPGGQWKFTMHGPGEIDFYNESQFEQIIPLKQIVLRHLRPMHRFEMTIHFQELAENQTHLTWVMVFDDDAEADRVRAFVPAANEQNFDRLEALLKDLAARRVTTLCIC
jgi:uncharacterized protein YndB with AHSA1/START domain